jgi:O-antigen ligase
VSASFMMRLFFSDTGSNSAHLINNHIGWAAFREHPIFGVGFGQHRNMGYLVTETHPAWSKIAYDHAHNDVIELLEGGGIVAFVLAAIAVLQLASYARRILSRPVSAPVRFVTVGFCIQIVACFFTASLGFGQLLHPQWIIPSGAMIAGLLGSLDRKFWG